MPFVPFFLVLALLLAPEPGRADAPSLTLEITGTPGMGFSGNCILATGAGSRRLDLEGTAPQRYVLSGSGLTCEIRKEARSGTLTVEVRRAGAVISHATIAGTAADVTIAVQ